MLALAAHNSHPEQLTDNIDSWVLWVAKDMKK